jgi:hypothetical protein
MADVDNKEEVQSNKLDETGPQDPSVVHLVLLSPLTKLLFIVALLSDTSPCCPPSLDHANRVQITKNANWTMKTKVQAMRIPPAKRHHHIAVDHLQFLEKSTKHNGGITWMQKKR